MTILLTKVRPPQRRKDVLRRVRLVDTLHQNLHRKLTFVSAPAGYGKTTLMVDFAADVDAQVCWYRIGPEDGDLVQFVQHIIAAFQQQFPGFGKALQDRLNNPGTAPDGPSIATELINEVEEQVQDFSVLVLDDYHLAGENQQIVDFLENLLEHLPDQLRILIGSRSVYGIPTASLYIRDELVTISADELRFRADELQKLVLQNYRMRLSQEEAEELAKRADGWIIAILLAVRAMENGALPKFIGATEQVYTYLAEEVVSRQSDELREFMLGASILTDFNEAQCNYLMQRSDSSLFLRSLEDRNLFVSRTETKDGNSYRFHQLFSEFLQDYFGRHDPLGMSALHARAAEWHYQREEWEAAIRHELAAGDRERAAAWMDAVAGQYFTSGRQVLLARWLGELTKGKDLRELAPHLMLYQAKALGNQFQFEACIDLLDLAEPILQENGDREALANAVTTRGMVYRFTGKPSQAIQQADAAQRLLTRNNDSRSARSRQWYQAERLRGVPLHVLGKTEEGVAHIQTAVDGLRELVAASEGNLKSVYLFDLAECLNDLGLIYITSGQILNAQQAFQEVLDIHIKIRSNLGALSSARNNIAYLHHQVGHYPAAWKEYSLALEHARAVNRLREEIAILSGQGELLLDLDEPEEAISVFDQALTAGGRDERQDLAAIYAGKARASRLAGNYNEAMVFLRQAASKPSQVFSKDEYSLELGATYFSMGHLDLAFEELHKPLAQWAREKPPQQTLAQCAYLLGLVTFLKEDTDTARGLIAQALEDSARLGYDQFLVVAAKRNLELSIRAAQAVKLEALHSLNARAAEFQQGMQQLTASPKSEHLATSNLEVFAFAGGEVRKNGEAIPSTVWRSSRAKALFFYILDRGKVRKEAIGLDFWPEFSPSKISSNFHATLWRVRQALGFKDAVVFEDEYYSLHPSIRVWYDVAEFEGTLKQAASSDLSETQRQELLRQAARIYQGPYLQDVFMDWAEVRREELRSKHLESLVLLAEFEIGAKHFREAKEIYEKIIAADPYRDEAHLALMKCLVASGAASAAVSHFKQYKKVLHRDLNSEPLPSLEAYYAEISAKPKEVI